MPVCSLSDNENSYSWNYILTVIAHWHTFPERLAKNEHPLTNTQRSLLVNARDLNKEQYATNHKSSSKLCPK